MLPPALEPPEVALPLDDDFGLLPPLLPQAARTLGAAASPATPAMPLSTDRRLGGDAGFGFDGTEWFSGMQGLQTLLNSFQRNRPQATKAKTPGGGNVNPRPVTVRPHCARSGHRNRPGPAPDGSRRLFAPAGRIDSG
jgi:hypothetical protein